MVSSVSASGASGGLAAVQGVQPSAAAPAATKPAASGEDTVKISVTAQDVQQETSAQVRLSRAEGQSVAQIASKLEITPHAVQSYLRHTGTGANEVEIAAIARFG